MSRTTDRAPKARVDIGRRLRAQRVLKGLTVDQVATSAGLTAQSVRAYERGAASCKADFLARIDGLGMDIRYIVLGTPRQEQPTP